MSRTAVFIAVASAAITLALPAEATPGRCVVITDGNVLRIVQDAGAVQNPDGACTGGSMITVGQTNPRLAGHVLRVAPQTAGVDRAAAVETTQSAPLAQAAAIAAAKPAVGRAMARPIRQDHSDVRVVGTRFLPDPDNAIDFRGMSEANQPPLNDAFNAFLGFFTPEETVASDDRADRPASAGAAQASTPGRPLMASAVE